MLGFWVELGVLTNVCLRLRFEPVVATHSWLVLAAPLRLCLALFVGPLAAHKNLVFKNVKTMNYIGKTGHTPANKLKAQR
jgi:hypothetical protein